MINQVPEIKRYKVMIFGETYTVATTDSEEQVKKAVGAVDELMHEISKRSGILEVKKIAVLVALHFALKKIENEQQVQVALQDLGGRVDQILGD